jgi:prophage regulatory protein
MIIFLRLGDVCKAKGCGKSSLYGEIQEGLFTPPVKTGKRASAWPSHEVEALNKARMAGKTEAEIKQIVSYLLAARHRPNDPAIEGILNGRSDTAPVEHGNLGADACPFAAPKSRSRRQQGPNAADGGQV